MKLTTRLLLVITIAVIIIGCSPNKSTEFKALVIGKGSMPQADIDQSGNVYVVYGSGDSLFCVISDNRGGSFTDPELIAVIPNLAASHMRGPQIAATTSGGIVIAC